MTTEWTIYHQQQGLWILESRGEGQPGLCRGDGAGTGEENLMVSGTYTASSKCWQSFLLLGYGYNCHLEGEILRFLQTLVS